MLAYLKQAVPALSFDERFMVLERRNLVQLLMFLASMASLKFAEEIIGLEEGARSVIPARAW